MENKREKLLLAPWDFDQSSLGWREIDKKHGPEEAAKLVEEYIKHNEDRILNPRGGEKELPITILYFHLGQLLAFCGKNKYTKAIKAFKNAFPTRSKCWDAYVSGTIGFLEEDRERIEESIVAVEKSNETDKKAGNIKILNNFIEALDQEVTDYKTVYNMPREGD